MKAYLVTDKEKEDNYSSFVWAETANKAKTSASDVASEADSYIDLRAIRIPFADDKEHLTINELTLLALENDMSYAEFELEGSNQTTYLDEDDLAGIYALGFETYVAEKIAHNGKQPFNKGTV